MKEKHSGRDFDFVILGAGVAGLAAAMYSGRLKMKTLCLGATHGTELPIGGVITTADTIENYPGFIKIKGEELAKNIREHAESYDSVEIKEEKAVEIKKKGSGFLIKTDKEEYSGKALLFATGTRWRKLDASGSRKFENKGIAYCALCDGPLFKNKIVGIAGGSYSAGKDALILSEYAKKVYIIYRGGKIHPEPVTLDKIKKRKNIEIINNTNIIGVKGERFLKSVVFDKAYKGKKEFPLDGLFVAIGHTALSELAKLLGVKLSKKGEIMINHKTSETNVKGIYAAGDVADKPFKQAITGVAEGCTAAYSAFEYITRDKIETV